MNKYFSLALCIFASVSVTKAMENPNADNMSLHEAARTGNLQRVQELINTGANVNEIDKRGDTPLVCAIANHQPEIVQFLVGGGGADVNEYTEGYTSLSRAVLRGNLDIVKILLNTPDIDVNQCNGDGETPFSLSIKQAGLHQKNKEDDAASRQKSILQALMDNGADVNQGDNRGFTPLHHAVARELDDVVKDLLAKGADVNSQNLYGQTPLDSAGAKNGKLTVLTPDRYFLRGSSLLKRVFTPPTTPRITGDSINCAIKKHHETALATKRWILRWTGTAGILAAGLGYLIGTKMHRPYIVPIITGTFGAFATWLGVHLAPEVRKRQYQQDLLESYKKLLGYNDAVVGKHAIKNACYHFKPKQVNAQLIQIAKKLEQIIDEEQ